MLKVVLLTKHTQVAVLAAYYYRLLVGLGLGLLYRLELALAAQVMVQVDQILLLLDIQPQLVVVAVDFMAVLAQMVGQAAVAHGELGQLLEFLYLAALELVDKEMLVVMVF